MFLNRIILFLPLLGIFLIPPLAPAGEENQRKVISSNPQNLGPAQTPTHAAEDNQGLGTHQTDRPDGENNVIYYSITTPEEEENKRKEEKEKIDRSWDLLQNIIIDPRSR